jgi:hypothetical protein
VLGAAGTAVALGAAGTAVALDGPVAVGTASARSLSRLVMEGAAPPGRKTCCPLALSNGMMVCIFS